MKINEIENVTELRDEIIRNLEKLPQSRENFFATEDLRIVDNKLYLGGGPLKTVYREDDSWHYKIEERGIVQGESLWKIDELVAMILNGYIFSMASDFELHHRIRYQDFRRVLFAYSDFLWTLVGEPYYSKAVIFYKNGVYEGRFNDWRSAQFDLLDDYESYALDLQEVGVSQSLKKKFSIFIDKPYRSKSGGIADFNLTFKNLSEIYKELVDELEKENPPISIMTKMKKTVDILKKYESLQENGGSI